MPVTSATTQYTRSAILAWANAALQTSCTSFHDIPSHDVGLLLYGVFDSAHDLPCAVTPAASNGGGDDAATAVPLLSDAELQVHQARHRATCMRYLQQLQFPSSPSAVTQHRNAEHVLRMIRELSAEEAELLRSEAPVSSTAGVVLVLGPSMTASAWISGGAFVEELKLWRWVRLMAERHRSSASAIRQTIRAFMQQEDAPALRAGQGRPPSELARRDASPPPRLPAAAVDATGATAAESADTHTAHSHAAVKRPRPESISPPAPTVPPLAPALLSPPASAAAPNTSLCTEAQRVAAAPDDAAGCGGGGGRGAGAAATAATPFVAAVPELQAALHTAQAQLQRALAEHRAPRPPSPSSTNTSARASGAGESDGGAGAPLSAAPQSVPAMNPCELQESACRVNITSTAADADLPSLPGTFSCDVCPALIAHAVQSSLSAIDDLEVIRARAIAACLQRDPVALLTALQSIV